LFCGLENGVDRSRSYRKLTEGERFLTLAVPPVSRLQPLQRRAEADPRRVCRDHIVGGSARSRTPDRGGHGHDVR
jgi:hypothetical protein